VQDYGFDVIEAARDLVERSTLEQGVPLQVEDEPAVARLVALVRLARPTRPTRHGAA